VTWDEIFAAVSPIMIDEAREREIRSALSRLVSDTDLRKFQETRVFSI
jgi:uncharacterized membrane protein YebE (DUF533 family)